MDEIWRTIEGWGNHEVSNTGRIRAKDRIIVDKNGLVKKCKGKMLNGSNDYLGYKVVVLTDYGRKQRYLVHRLVASAFIPNPENKPYINHIDNNPGNNVVTNLEWCTPKENTDWMIVQGRFKRTETWLRNLDIALQPRRKKVRRIDPATGEVVVYDGINKTKNDGFTTSSVSQCCNGIRHSHHGYIWEFA